MPVERPLGDFGATLRSARERRGVTLRHIADQTRISVRALEALERNDIAQLPGGIFSRAFVRAYASEVGLDPEQTIADFITQFPHDLVTQGHPRTRLSGEIDSRPRTALSTWAIRALLVVAAAALLYFGLASRFGGR